MKRGWLLRGGFFWGKSSVRGSFFVREAISFGYASHSVGCAQDDRAGLESCTGVSGHFA